MEFKEMMSRGITSSILTAEDETFLDKDGNIVSVEKFVPVIGLSGHRTCEKCGQIMKGRVFNGHTDTFVCLRCLEKEEKKKRSQREIAETLLPDMSTVPMTDEEIERFMRG